MTSNELPKKKAKKQAEASTRLRPPIRFPIQVMASCAKMPLHILKEVEKARPVCSYWNRFVATRPAHYKQRFLLYIFLCSVVYSIIFNHSHLPI